MFKGGFCDGLGQACQREMRSIVYIYKMWDGCEQECTLQEKKKVVQSVHIKNGLSAHNEKISLLRKQVPLYPESKDLGYKQATAIILKCHCIGAYIGQAYLFLLQWYWH